MDVDLLEPDLDHLPLAERRRGLLVPPFAERGAVDAAANDVSHGAHQEWPGLPRGVQFNPSDGDLLWHLTAKVGSGKACPHPFIGEFIKSLDEERGFVCTHPQDLPGVKQDGTASYFFHRIFKSDNNGNDRYIRWQKVGKPRTVISDGSLQGCKEVFILYNYKTNDGRPQKTNWRLHQYCIGDTAKDEEDLVVSKLFYNLKDINPREGTRKALSAPNQVRQDCDPRCEASSNGTMVRQDCDTRCKASSNGTMLKFPKNSGDFHAEYPKEGEKDSQFLRDASVPQSIKCALDLSQLVECQSPKVDQDRNNSCLSGNSKASIHDKTVDTSGSQNDVSVAHHNPSERRRGKIGCADVATPGNFIQARDIEGSQEGRITDKHPNCNQINSSNDVLDDELDHVSLQERYSILSTDKCSCPSSFDAMVCAKGSRVNDLEANSYRPVTKANGLTPKSESDEMNKKGTIYGQDIFSILQEISAAPAIMDSIEDDSGRAHGEDLLDTQHSSRRCFINSFTDSRAAYSLGNSVPNSTYGGADHCSEGSANARNNLVIQYGLSQQTHETAEENANPFCETPNSDRAQIHVKVEDDTDYVKNDSETSDATQITVDNTSLLSFPCSSSSTAPFLCEVRNCYHLPGRTKGHEKVFDFPSLSARSDAETNSSLTSLSKNKTSRLPQAKLSTFLVDVKSEPSWEGEKTNPSESIIEESRLSSENGSSTETARAVPKCSSKGGLGANALGCTNPPLENCHRIFAGTSSGVKDTAKEILMESEFSGLCENNSLNISEPNLKAVKASSENLGGDGVHGSCRRTRRKTATDPVEKALEDDAVYGSRRRKRRKTATDSVEKALEEDIPGLLQLLLNRGITVEEIKLYGVEEDDEVLQNCTVSDFGDLEAVITKLFSQRASLLKFSTARHVKGARPVYCLTCLISLIEQARYLRFRDSSVEWGWCRDLQSFMFLFKRHNRIVLERPEYGYATYFFEIVQSLPIEWQIRRLVTAMKLTSCSRTSLIENKPLLVGEDLTEGEARVLEEYGWTPNTGLGTMLNYCDRVVHDRKSEMYRSEWRLRIGKLLMNGYDGGRAIIADISMKFGNFAVDQNAEIKWENPA